MSVPAVHVSVVLLALGLPIGTCCAQAIPATASGRFEALDRNGDGVVSKLEYNSDALFAVIDSDNNNRISSTELEAVLGPQADGGPSAADRIRHGDSNNDGELTDEELRRGVDLRFQRLDSNRDENVDLAELKAGFGRP